MYEQDQPKIDYRARLKPASQMTTGTTRVFSGLSFAAGLTTTALGVFFFSKAQRQPDQAVKADGALLSTAVIVIGGLNALLGLAGLKTAKAARNARHFVEHAEADQATIITPRQTENLSNVNTQVQAKNATQGQVR